MTVVLRNTRRRRSRTLLSWLVGLWCAAAAPPLHAVESWQAALARMPLEGPIAELNWTNWAKVMLKAYQSNAVVKALILMPGATDEFYFYRRAKAALTNRAPTLLDAVAALTNQTNLRAAFLPPMLLLHTREDLLEASFTNRHEPTVRHLHRTLFLPLARYNDRDWDYLLPYLTAALQVNFVPGLDSADSYHFYRHSFAACNLTGWEALIAISLAGRSVFTVDDNRVLFEVDRRPREAPQ